MVNSVGIFSSKVHHFNISTSFMLETFQNVFPLFYCPLQYIFLCLNYAVYICTVWRPLLQTRSSLLFCLITNKSIYFFLMWEYLVPCTVVCVEPKILHILLSVWDLDFLPTVVFGFNRILVGLGSLPSKSNPRECISTSGTSITREREVLG